MAKSRMKISLLSIVIVILSMQFTVGTETKSNDNVQLSTKTQTISKDPKLMPDFGNIPLYFIPNEGQVNEKALFYAKTSGYTLRITMDGLVFDSYRHLESNDKRKISKEGLDNWEKPRENVRPGDFKRNVSRFLFQNVNDNPEIVPLGLTKYKVNYFIGNDENNWKTDITTSKSVLYKDLYKNIDLKVYGIEKQIEYDWIIKPGGNPEKGTYWYG